jgi:hypothetical protein
MAASADEHAAPQARGLVVAVLDFGFADTSGEARDQSPEHRARIEGLAAGLKGDLAREGGVRIVNPICRPEPCEVGETPLDEVLRAAKEAGADLVVMGAVHKMSTLVQWAKTLDVRVADSEVLAEKLYSFRGDSDEAYARAEAFMSRDVLAALAAERGPEPRSPVKLAVFGFELLDVSGGAGVIAADDIDKEQLRLATEMARQLIGRSGRYALVDVDKAPPGVEGADRNAAEAHSLHECNGCDAALAEKLGADQSLVGVVTRVTRTDYNVTYTLRDAHTGKIVAVEQTDMRVGANYSWPRGARSLIRDKFLASDVAR